MSGNFHTISWDASQYVEGDVGDLYIGRDLRSLGAVDFTTGVGGGAQEAGFTRIQQERCGQKNRK